MLEKLKQPKSLFSIISIIFGSYFLYLNGVAFNFFTPLMERCQKNPNSEPLLLRTHIYPLDFLICLNLPFFKFANEVKAVVPILGLLQLIFLAIFVYCAFESLNEKQYFFIRFVPLWVMLAQVVGVCVIFPLLWAPIYWYYKMQTNGEDKYVGTNKDFLSIKVIYFATSLYTINCIMLSAFPDNQRITDISISFFCFSPIVLPFIWMIVRFFGSNDVRGGNDYIGAKIRVYYFFSGVMTFWYFLIVIDFIRFGSPFKILADLIVVGPKLINSEQAAHFLLVDFIGLVVFLFYFVLVESGFSLKEAIKFLLYSVVASPGTAFLLYFASAEVKIIGKKLKDD